MPQIAGQVLSSSEVSPSFEIMLTLQLVIHKCNDERGEASCGQFAMHLLAWKVPSEQSDGSQN